MHKQLLSSLNYDIVYRLDKKDGIFTDMLPKLKKTEVVHSFEYHISFYSLSLVQFFGIKCVIRMEESRSIFGTE